MRKLNLHFGLKNRTVKKRVRKVDREHRTLKTRELGDHRRWEWLAREPVVEDWKEFGIVTIYFSRKTGWSQLMDGTVIS